MTKDLNLPSLVRRLTDLLAKQEAELRGVVTQLREQRCCFVSTQGRDLEAAAQALETPTTRCLDLEHERVEILTAIGSILGVPPQGLTASRLAATVTGSLGPALIAQAARTKAVAAELNVETRVGGRLLEWSAHCYEGLLRHLAEATQGPPIYARDGKHTSEESGMRLFDAVV